MRKHTETQKCWEICRETLKEVENLHERETFTYRYSEKVISSPEIEEEIFTDLKKQSFRFLTCLERGLPWVITAYDHWDTIAPLLSAVCN